MGNGQLGNRRRLVSRSLLPAGTTKFALVDAHIGVAPDRGGRGGEGHASARRGNGLGRDARRVGQEDVGDTAELIVGP